MAIGEGHGTTLTFGPFTFQLLSMEGPSMERGDIDTSFLGSTNNVRTFVPTTLTDNGTLDVTVQYDPTIQPVVVAGSQGALTITMGVGVAYGWACASAYLKSFSASAALDELMTASASFKLSGAIVWDTTT